MWQDLKKQEYKIDSLILSTNNNINIFKEYHTHLISDVVIGQMDVRGIESPEYEKEYDFETNIENEESENKDT